MLLMIVKLAAALILVWVGGLDIATNWAAIAYGFSVLAGGLFLADVAKATGLSKKYSLEKITSAYTTRDLFLMAALIAIGGIAKGEWGKIRMIVEPLGPFASIVIGPGFYMWGTLGAYLIRKPLSGTISMTLGGVIEILIGNPYGLPVLIFNFYEGLGPDLGYTVFGFKRYNLATSIIGCLIGSVVGIGYRLLSTGFAFLPLGLQLLTWGTGFAGAALGGVLGYYIAKGIERLGIIPQSEAVVVE
jgi:energy-coupling factor transport system substrate-specific component